MPVNTIGDSLKQDIIEEIITRDGLAVIYRLWLLPLALVTKVKQGVT
jgi:hypothetical protein